MQRITVINIKGGCGKTTVATNLASTYAASGRNTTLVDYDPQGSSMYWLNQRPSKAAKINGIAAYPSNDSVTKSWRLQLPPETERVIVDTPPGLNGLDLIDQLKGTHTILIPVLPSSIDTHATADFIRDLYLRVKVQSQRMRLCIVCNRVKSNTLSFQALQRFLDRMNITVIAKLRETQNYVKAADEGLGVHEITSRTNAREIEDWQEVIQWLDHGKSDKTDQENKDNKDEWDKSLLNWSN